MLLCKTAKSSILKKGRFMISFKTFSMVLLLSISIHVCPMDSNSLRHLTVGVLRRSTPARWFWQDANRGPRMSLQYEEEVRRDQEEAREKEVRKKEEQRHHRQEEELKRDNERRQKIEEAINTNSLY